jgi:hypothetical protein
MPGVIEIRRQATVGEAITALLTLIGASEASEWENKVIFLP